MNQLIKGEDDTYEIGVFDTVVKAKRSFRLIVVSSVPIDIKYAITVNLINDSDASLLQSLGDIVLNKLYKDQRRSTLAKYKGAVDYHMELYQEPYLNLLDALRNLEPFNNASIDYFLEFSLEDFKYEYSDLIEERMLLEQNILE